MKRCPYCTAQNLDQDTHCIFCGRDLSRVPAQPPFTNIYNAPDPADVPPTQPLHPQAPQYPSQGARSYPYPPEGGATQPYPPQPGSYPPQGQYSSPNYVPPAYPAQSYPPQQYPQQPYGQPYPYPPGNEPPYVPPPANYPRYPEAYPPEGSRRKSGPSWTLLLVILGLLLFCGAAFAVWTVITAARNGVTSLGAAVSTQVASVFNAPSPTPEITATLPALQATPWPTFTPQPTDPEPGEATPDSRALEMLLSPECRAAVDAIRSVNDRLTERPTSPLEEEWRNDLNQAVSDLRQYCGSLENASPVPGLVSEAQRNLALASSEFDQANQLFKEGVENWNPTKLLEAGQHVAAATQYLNQALAELGKIGN